MRKLLIPLFIPLLFIIIAGCGSDAKSGGLSQEQEVDTYANEEFERKIEEFKSEYDVEVTAEEVQYNMPNNLDKAFYLEGEMEICDYYNYGFKNESRFFCGKLTPFDGGNSWYLYLDRETFDSIYQPLLESNSMPLAIIALIPNEVYKKNQGNMALVMSLAPLLE